MPSPPWVFSCASVPTRRAGVGPAPAARGRTGLGSEARRGDRPGVAEGGRPFMGVVVMFLSTSAVNVRDYVSSNTGRCSPLCSRLRIEGAPRPFFFFLRTRLGKQAAVFDPTTFLATVSLSGLFQLLSTIKTLIKLFRRLSFCRFTACCWNSFAVDRPTKNLLAISNAQKACPMRPAGAVDTTNFSAPPHEEFITRKNHQKHSESRTASCIP